MTAWFDLARKVLNLTVQLNAKSQELHDAHRALAKAEDKVKFYTASCDEKDRVRLKLIAEHNEQKRRLHDDHDRSLVPLAPSAPLGSRDRVNAARLAGELALERLENEGLRRANARLAVLVDECETKHGRNPS